MATRLTTTRHVELVKREEASVRLEINHVHEITYHKNNVKCDKSDFEDFQ